MADDTLTATLERGSCPHMAVLLRDEDELPAVLASFYALGAKRGALCVHRAWIGERELARERFAAAGLDVVGLEDAGVLEVVEFDPDEPPLASAAHWGQRLEDALRDGFSALWYARFAAGADEGLYRSVDAYERAWDEAFHGRQVVTLCPYVVGALHAVTVLDRLAEVTEMHDGVLVPEARGGYTLLHRG
jgi:MEDS: MEthanogen/methylotroph, DcmR Sensory domain